MKFKLLHTSPLSSRAVLLFAGWGMDPRPFEGLAPAGYDLVMVWDYCSLSPGELPAILSRYDEVVVVAWSFGVPAAAWFMASHPELPVTARVAVNGTLHPVDDLRGIPRAVFDGTLGHLDENGMVRFYRRMCGGAASYRHFADVVPARDIDGLKDELRAIDSLPACGSVMWDKAFVSESDLVIPPANQHMAWSDEAYETLTLPGAHMPDFQDVLSMCLTDKSLVERKFDSAAETYDANAGVQHAVSDRLLREASSEGRPSRVLEIGAGTGYATRRLAEMAEGCPVVWDLALQPKVRSLHLDGLIVAKACDAETEIGHMDAESADLIFSASTMQWFNSLPCFLRNVERVLAPGGTALLSTFGPQTMGEVHSSAGTRSRFPAVSSIRRMVPAGLETLLMEEDEITLDFSSPMEVLRHIKLTGVNALPSADPSGAARRVLSDYPLTDAGTARLTYRPIYIKLRKKS